MPMTPPEPEEIGFVTKVAAAVGAFFTTGFGVWKHTQVRIDRANERINAKADKEQVEKHHGALLDLYGKHDKVLDLLREKEERDVVRHIELKDVIHELGTRIK